MTTFANSYLLSGDMPHCGHINTFKDAEKEIGPTQFVLCASGLKNNSRLNLEQRKIDLMYTLLVDPEFDATKRDPEEIITLAKDPEEIRNVIQQSEKIVRGIRGEEDMQDIVKLLKYYGVEDAAHKGHFVIVPDEFKNVSSTTNKIVLQEWCTDFDKIPALYRNLFGNEVYKKLKTMEFPRKTRNISEKVKLQITQNIENYFAKIALL